MFVLNVKKNHHIVFLKSELTIRKLLQTRKPTLQEDSARRIEKTRRKTANSQDIAELIKEGLLFVLLRTEMSRCCLTYEARSNTNFSLQQQYILKQTRDENKKDHQQEYIILMYGQILKTSLTRVAYQSVRRINISSLALLKELNMLGTLWRTR